MKYVIEYKTAENHNLTSKLHIYDFGHVKGFLYNDDFTLYKILSKNDCYETTELFEGNIPKNVFSIEEYSCEYVDGTYKILGFDIVVRPFLKFESLPFESLQTSLTSSLEQVRQPLVAKLPPRRQPFRQEIQEHPQQQQVQHQQPFQLGQVHQQQVHQQQQIFQPSQHLQPLPQRRHAYKKKNTQIMDESSLIQVSMREQQVEQQNQPFSAYPNVVKPQWTSLEQLVKGPLILIGQEHQKQLRLQTQCSSSLMPKGSSSLQVRRHHAKLIKHAQNSKHLN